MLVVLHQHDRTVNRALGRNDQRKIALMNPESAHAVIRCQKIENLIRLAAFNPSLDDRQQLMIDWLKHRIHDGDILQHTGQRIKPDAAGDAFIFGFFLGACNLFSFNAGLGLDGCFVDDILDAWLNLSEVNGCSNIVQGEIGFCLLFEADALENAPGLVIGDNAGAVFDGDNVAFTEAAFLCDLFGRHVLADAFGTDQVS